MRFGLLQAAHCPPGHALHARYLEVLDEAMAAEQAGFDFYAVPEQHFDPGGGVTNVSASEVMLAAVAARTSVMRLVWLSAVLSIHHPLRVAEAAATLDVISSGRFELCTARSNDLPTLRAFEIDPSTTRSRWQESLELIAEALTTGEVEHRGEFWNIPRVQLNPRPMQTPHPPLFYASTSIDGHRVAAANGLGVVSGNTLPGGWDYVRECAEVYKSALPEAPKIGAYVNDSLASFVFAAHVADTKERALREVEWAARSIVEMVTSMFTTLAGQAADYGYMDGIRSMYERRDDLEFLVDRAPYVSVGTPDFLIERFRDLEAMGYDSAVLRIDGMPHEVCMRSIETFGREVLPAFARSPV